MGRGAWKAAVHGVAKSDFTFTFHFPALEKEMATHSRRIQLPGESQGRGSLVGCRLWGRTGSDMTEVTAAAAAAADCSLPGSSAHGDSSGKNTGVGCCTLLQGIFPT